MSESICSICKNETDNTTYRFRDFHLGNNKYYTYFQCARCECLQKSDTISNDPAHYYPDNYYSYSKDDKTTLLSKIKWKIRNIRNSYYQTNKGVVGKLIHLILPCMSVAMIEKIKPKCNWKILDVGCGNDALMLQYLSEKGISALVGVDPFIKENITIGNVKILKKSVEEINEKYNIITLNHSFEHMRDQKKILLHCKSILTPEGTIMLRIPTVSSYAWNHYKEYWPNLDSPRHLYLHSIKSITMLAKECDLSIKDILFDSTAFQFWGAELYKNKFPLHNKKIFFQIIQLLFRIYYSITKWKIVENYNKTSQGDTITLILSHSH